MKFEVLLNVYLTWQLLLQLVVRLLLQVAAVKCFCGWFRVQGEAGGAYRVWKVLNTSARPDIRCDGGRQVGWERGVGQGEDGSCRKCNN